MASLAAIRKTVVIQASIEQVWKTVATAEGIGTWFMPNTLVAEVGREFVLRAGPWGDSNCVVTHVEAPYRLEFDWDKDWHMTFELKQVNESTTEFTLTHAGWDSEGTTAFGQPHAMVRNIMDGGWEQKVHEDLPNQFGA